MTEAGPAPASSLYAPPMRLQLPRGILDLSAPAVMGVLNVTPDSFSDGGRFASRDAALRRAETMLKEGATLIDVGGESTRPGAEPVSDSEEMDRILPVVEALAGRGCIVSVDTCKPAVMEAACRAGAQLINDIRALSAPGAVEVAVRHRAAVCLMHMQGEPRTMQNAPRYDNVVEEVAGYLEARVAACEAGGIPRERLLVDPGFGFGKNLDHNLRLLAGLGRLRAAGCPVLVGLSRKSMFQHLLALPVGERLHASVAAAALAVWLGAAIVRAHDVAGTVHAVKLAAAVRNHLEGSAAHG